MFISALYAFWLPVYVMKEDLKKRISGTTHFMFMITYFCFFGIIMLGMTLYEISTADILDYRWLNYYVNTYSAPYVIGVCLSWIFLHFRFFSEKPEEETLGLRKNASFVFTPKDSMMNSMVASQTLQRGKFTAALKEVDSPLKSNFSN